MSRQQHELTDDQLADAREQLKGMLAPQGAPRGAGGPEQCPYDDGALESAIRAGAAAAPVGKFDMGMLLKILAAVLAAVSNKDQGGNTPVPTS